MTTYGPIGSSRALAFEPNLNPPDEPEQDEPQVDPERVFAEEMWQFFFNHEGPFEVDSMQATIEEIKRRLNLNAVNKL